MTNSQIVEALREDVELIRSTAGDLDEGIIHSTNRRRGNIGGIVTRACDRLTTLITQLEQAVEVDIEAGARAIEETLFITHGFGSSQPMTEAARACIEAALKGIE